MDCCDDNSQEAHAGPNNKLYNNRALSAKIWEENIKKPWKGNAVGSD